MNNNLEKKIVFVLPYDQSCELTNQLVNCITESESKLGELRYNVSVRVIKNKPFEKPVSLKDIEILIKDLPVFSKYIFIAVSVSPKHLECAEVGKLKINYIGDDLDSILTHIVTLQLCEAETVIDWQTTLIGELNKEFSIPDHWRIPVLRNHRGILK